MAKISPITKDKAGINLANILNAIGDADLTNRVCRIINTYGEKLKKLDRSDLPEDMKADYCQLSIPREIDKIDQLKIDHPDANKIRSHTRSILTAYARIRIRRFVHNREMRAKMKRLGEE